MQLETVVPPVFGKEFELRPSRREAPSVGFFCRRRETPLRRLFFCLSLGSGQDKPFYAQEGMDMGRKSTPGFCRGRLIVPRSLKEKESSRFILR